MTAYTELTVRMLNEAAGFFRRLADQNEPVKKQMNDNASVFEQVAQLLEQNPQGAVGDKTYVFMSIKLLQDAAAFFRTLSKKSELIEEQMLENAAVYEQMAELLQKNPQGNL